MVSVFKRTPKNHQTMTKINVLIFICAFVSLSTMSQNKVCENAQDELADLNTIGKCAIEEFKSSNKKEFVTIQTRNRFVRKRNNSYLSSLKKNLAATTRKEAVKKEEKVLDNTTTSNTNLNIDHTSNALLKDVVRFNEVSNAPFFITCADGSAVDKDSCLKETVVSTILDNFTYPFDAAASGIEGTVWVRFVIDKDGYVKNVATLGPDNGELLEEEAKRLVSFLPKFMPGKHNNQFVNVEYFMPIDFQLDE